MSCLRRYVCWICLEKRFIVLFGIIYAVVMLSLMLPSLKENPENISVYQEFSSRDQTDGIGKLVNAPNHQMIYKHKTESYIIVANSSESKVTIYNGTKQSYNKTAAAALIFNPNFDCKLLPPPKFTATGERPLTALSSFPGSGNTWMRVLLSSVSGITTGDIYRDGAFAKTPGFSYRKDDTVLVVKTHHPFWDDFNGDDPGPGKGKHWKRAVVIVRHPLDATMSGFSFFKTRGSHTKKASIDHFLKSDGSPTQSWNKWAHDQIRNWGRCIKYWVSDFKDGPVYIVFYEHLKANLEKELTYLMEFLEVPVDPNRMKCTVESNMQAKFKRQETVDKRKVYDASMLAETEAMLTRTIQLLYNNYTHFKSDFSVPDSYAPDLVKPHFSAQPPLP